MMQNSTKKLAKLTEKLLFDLKSDYFLSLTVTEMWLYCI